MTIEFSHKMSLEAHARALDLFRSGRHEEAQSAWETLLLEVSKKGDSSMKGQFKMGTIHGHLSTCSR